MKVFTGNRKIDFHRSETDPLAMREVPAGGDDEDTSSPNDATKKDSPGRTRQTTGTTQQSSERSLDDHHHHTATLGDQHHDHLGAIRPKERHGCGRGIVADIKRTLGTHWKAEMSNLNGKTLACSFFLFFACIAPAITFGAIYAKATYNHIGAVEMILATSWCGIVYALIGGQPMMINGGTGPVLAFSSILYTFSQSLDVPFLTLNAWIGIWVCIYMIIAAVVDLNRIITYATRFTDEIFSFLIAVIFIINAIGSPFSTVGIYHYFDFSHNSHDPYQDDPYYSHWASALLSLMLCLGTVYLSFLLRKIKFSPFLPNQMLRNAATDFAVVTSILLMSIIGDLVFSSIPLETLTVPEKFAPTYQCCTETCETNWPNDCFDQAEPYGTRPWLVDLGDLNGKDWIPIMAAGPAALAFILVFLDDGITWHLINEPMHKLTHGEAYNWDTIIIGVMIFINSLLGLPWLVAATVRSLNHIHAMAEKSPDGKILSVQETRLTHLFIHLLCLASIFALEVLKLIPVPVLYGVFLFMGLVSLGTNQFWGRIEMFFMQPSKYPVHFYTQYMKPKRMHLFTGIQLFLFALLYTVKSIKSIAIAFPLLIAACIPVRLFILPKIFTEEELILIDSDDNTVKTWLASHGKEDGSQKSDKFSDHDDIEMQKPSIPPAAEEGEEKEEVKPYLASVPPKPRPQRARPSRDRRRSVSCPAPHMMFGDAAPTPPRPLPVGPNMFFTDVASPRIMFEIPEVEEEVEPGETPMHTEAETDVSERGHEGSFVNETPGAQTATPTPLGRGESFTGGGEAERRPRRRRQRKKTVSCPAHMLFHESNQHVASNYFFG